MVFYLFYLLFAFGGGVVARLPWEALLAPPPMGKQARAGPCWKEACRHQQKLSALGCTLESAVMQRRSRYRQPPGVLIVWPRCSLGIRRSERPQLTLMGTQG